MFSKVRQTLEAGGVGSLGYVAEYEDRGKVGQWYLVTQVKDRASSGTF